MLQGRAMSYSLCPWEQDKAQRVQLTMKKVRIGHFGDIPIGQIAQHCIELHVGSLQSGPSKDFLKKEGGITDLVPVRWGGS